MTGTGQPWDGGRSADPLRRVVALMAELRAACPWDAEQTHASLAPYAIEEAYELAEAAESGDRAGLLEELGDVLLQVVFHAQVAAEHEAEPFDIDDVAAGLRDKLVRRHPHVFAPPGAERPSPADVERAWQRIKESEAAGQRSASTVPGAAASAQDGARAPGHDDPLRPGTQDDPLPPDAQDDPLAGIPLAMPALARAQKAARRLRRRDDDEARLLTGAPGIGRELMALVLRAEADGIDAEAALRGHLRALPPRATAQDTPDQ